MICPFASPNIGGVEAHLDKLIDKLLARGYRIHLIAYQPLTTKARGPAYEKRGNLEIYRVRWFGYNLFHKLEPYFFATFLYLFPGLFFKCCAFYMKRHGEIDVIHAHGLTGALIARLLTKIYPKRSVTSTHAVYNFEQRKLLAFLVKSILRGFDKILAVGEMSRRELEAIGIPADRIEIHPNWIDLDRFRPMDKMESKRVLGLETYPFVVLYLGRLIEQKGVLTLLAAAKELKGKATFVFVGDGPLAEVLRKEAAGTDQVVFRGKVDHADLVRYYNAADLFTLPSQYNEGFATVILEALACGTPALVTNRGCVPWYVDETVADLVEPVRDVLVDKMRGYIEQPDILRGKAERCRSYAEKHFSEKNFEVILRSYDE